MEKLSDLIDKAEKEGLWLYSRFHGLWFSPAELRVENDRGRFCWGPVNWRLRPPSEYLAKLARTKHKAEDDMAQAQLRM